MTVTLQTDEGRDTLRFERRLAHAPERVWRAITEPDELARWFPSAVIYEQRVGAPMQFDFGGAHGQDVWPGEVLAWEPPRVFSFGWSEDVLRFELTPTADSTLLVFTHAFAHQPGKPARDGAGWLACLDSFDALLDGTPPPSTEESWAAHHEDRLADFGELAIEEAGSSRRVRLMGPYVEVDGRPAVSVDLDGRKAVLVVRADGQAFEDGAEVVVRDGSAAEPGEPIASGVLRDPLARRGRASSGR